MSRMAYGDVAHEHRVRLQGSYNAAVTTCRECGVRFFGDKHPKHLGFASVRGEAVLVRECRECFAKDYHHTSPGHYTTIVLLMELERRRDAAAAKSVPMHDQMGGGLS